jgi:carbon-monoxide dehydrogenase medium subunit
MTPAGFEYARPTTLAEALSLLEAHREDAKVLAGGQSLIPLLKLRLLRPSLLVDVGRIPDLRGVRRENGRLVVGATTTYRELMAETPWPFLREALAEVADVQVRNRGTVGGSLAHADPAGDLPAVALAAEASLVVRSTSGERRIAAAEFFQGPFSTALAPGELVAAVEFPVPGEGVRAAYRKVRHPASGYAVVGVAICLERDGDGAVRRVAIGVTGVGPAPYRAPSAEALLVGSRPTPETIREVSRRLAEGVDVAGDMYASAEYRRHLLQVVGARTFAEVLAR